MGESEGERARAKGKERKGKERKGKERKEREKKGGGGGGRGGVSSSLVAALPCKNITHFKGLGLLCGRLLAGRQGDDLLH